MNSTWIGIVSTLGLIVMPGMVCGADDVPEPFPTRGLLPKAEIGALRLLEAHPEYDGRGVVVAIFDTGVDPGADGLTTTTEGKPKVIDMIDGTGSGDVVTTTIRKAEAHALEGLSGRKLKIDPDWNNPSGDYHLGIKRGYDLFPAGLVRRLKRERKKRFDIAQQQAELKLRSEIVAWEAAHPKPTQDEKKEREELKARLEQLQSAGKQAEDPGPLYDCIVFHDGNVWRAVVDTDEDGDLAEEQRLTDFRLERQFASFPSAVSLNFAVNVYEKGRLLSIVTDCGAHGTHVAGIVAGHFPDEPELNGIAPGAQIVSVKIGDTRLGSMETGAGMVRGLSAVVRNRCDLINMSYGEPTSAPDRGRLIDLFSEVVNEHGVIFVSSAGNAGPALSTVGAPGGTSSAAIGVGAYLSPEMAAVEYALRKRSPELPYTWTSRGPTADGDLGINIFAPGGAIAPVPNWTLNRSQQMNGTSMASPNACGGIAVVLSGLKAEGIAYSPHSVRRAIQNTARPVERVDSFTQGPGLLQVDRAFEHLGAHQDADGERLRFDARLLRQDKARGILLREPHSAKRPYQTRVTVRPMFRESAANAEKIGFQMRVTLRSTADWVEVGSYLVLSESGETFEVRVDPTDLEPGAHYAEVHGYDARSPERGPIFRLPVTVIRPIEPGNGEPAQHETGHPRHAEPLVFEPGKVERRFFAVPQGATWADISLKLRSDDGQKRLFVLHAIQLGEGHSFEAAQTQHYLLMSPERNVIRSIRVTGGRTLELCLAQYWSSLGASELEYEIAFHGLAPDRNVIQVAAGEPGAEIEVAAFGSAEKLDVSARLTKRRTALLPDEADLRPLTPGRDKLPDEQTSYRLLLTYRFEQAETGKVTPRFPEIDGLLYDSPFGTQMWMIFDGGKRRVAADDYDPQAVELKKGPHVLKLLLRHTDSARLEKLKKTLLYLERPLKKSLTLSVFPSRAEAENGASKLASRVMVAGETSRIFVASPSATNVPSKAVAGEQLLGQITFGSSDDSRDGAGHRPGSYPITWTVPPGVGADSKKKTEDAAAAEEASTAETRSEGLRDFRVAQLKKLSSEKQADEFESLAVELLEQYPNHRPILLARLHRLDTLEHRKERLPEVVAAADAVLNQIDTAILIEHFGSRVDADDAAAVKQRKQMEELRTTLADTLYRKGRALGYMELPDVIAKHPIADPELHDRQFEENFSALAKWVDTTEKKYALLTIRRDRRKGRYGRALKLLNKHISASSPNYWYIKKRRDIYEQLGWTHLFDYERRWLPIRFPAERESF